MIKKMRYILLLLVFLFCNSICQKKYHKKLLSENWVVDVNNCPRSSKQPEKNYQLSTSIPTTLHLDLLKHNKISDPFFANNWEQQKWISECNAFYKLNISVSQEFLNYQVVNLVFEGIDTYSTVKLNSKQILKTKNAFVQYRLSVKDLLKKQGENLLQVQIKPTKTIDDKGQSENKMPFPYAHTRKACYQYSWDWAPFMNTLGIWKNVYLQAYDQIAIDYTWIQVQKLQEKEAILKFSIKTHLYQSLKQPQTYQVVVQNNGLELNRSYVTGEETYFTVKIQDPKLWWPNGIGEPYMYDFEVKIISGQKVIHDTNISYGIRTVRLDQSSNAFTLILNGYKIYCKGANYVPPDMMYPRVGNSKILTLLEDTVRSNFNMIRVWGGGQYESDQFYHLASKMGIMIFHDFMFSDSIYPSSQQFLENVQVQIVQQIRRIRNYPALVLWAGNNEILQGIQSWGWRSEKYKDDYNKLFEQLIPSIVQNQCPYIPYVASSPVKGVGNKDFERGGDIHYWGVWAGKAPFQDYQKAVGPFNSEFGTQSLPVWQSIQQFTTSEGRSYSSQELLSHERHNSQFHTLRKYMQMYAKESLNFEMQAYQSGLVQAYGIEIAIKAQRASKNTKSMGTLYWQLNDAWPAISWSAIDYYGRWKPLQYKAKTLYQNVIAFYHHNSQAVIGVNDNLYEVSCYVETKIITFSGQVLKTYNQTLTLRQNQARHIFSLQSQHRLLQNNGSNIVVFTKLIMSDKKEVSVSTFLKPYKELKLPKCQLYVKLLLQTNSISLAANCLIKSLHIYHPSNYLSFTDNYIDVIPGEVHTTTLLKAELKNVQKDIKFKSYLQVYNQEQLKVVFVE